MARGDLADEQWQRIAAYLPPERSGKRGHPYLEHRRILNGMLWIDRTRAPWRDLPERCGPWQTCYDRLTRWQRQGLWTRLLQALQADQDYSE
jgi:transposase